MDNQLMDQSDWASLGLVNLPGDKPNEKVSEKVPERANTESK